MASIKNLQMADTVLSNPNVEYRKGFMGLGSKAIYRPTGSPIAAQVLDYTADMGRKLLDVMACQPQELDKKLDSATAIAPTQIGNNHLELCLSRDHQFAALQLFTFADLVFKPLSEVKIYTGHAAQLIAKLF